MKNVIDKGNAQKVLENTPNNGRIWYLPHHGVTYPRKDKLRVVFDCAAYTNQPL